MAYKCYDGLCITTSNIVFQILLQSGLRYLLYFSGLNIWLAFIKQENNIHFNIEVFVFGSENSYINVGV